MKIISWNVNGIRAAWGHGLSQFIDSFGADIYAFQETKTSERIHEIERPGYFPYWSICDSKNGYSGTLVLSREKPLYVNYGIGDDDFDVEGRIITLEYGEFYLVNCYVPNSQHAPDRYDYRVKWDVLLRAHLITLSSRKPVIVCGDFNCPISDDDIYEASKWVEINSNGFLTSEREGLILLTKNGFVDSYRFLHPRERGKYSWWSNRLNKRGENRGWRLDYFFVSERLCPKLRESTMLTDVHGSDHCPLLLDIKIGDKEKTAEKRHASHKTIYTYADLIEMEKKGDRYDFIQYADMTDLWDGIDWDAAEGHLLELQSGIAKAAYMRDWELIARRQKKLVGSLDAKILAVKRVCSTASCCGVDKIRWESSHEKMEAALSLDPRGYRARPARMLILKCKNGKERRLHMDTYFDRAMQTLYAYALDPVAESWGDRKSFAYRRGRSAFDLHAYIMDMFSGDNPPEWAIIADVKGCYEHISHDWILKNIPLPSNILREFLDAGYVFSGELFPTKIGVGVGCTISPIIANMTLDGMQAHIFRKMHPGKDIGDIDYADGNLVRYADDIIVSARSEESANQIKNHIVGFLEERGLEISKEKTKIINVNDGFTFMSRQYEKKNGHFSARPSDEAVERFMASLRKLIENYTGSQESLIKRLNKKIDGWVTYHKITEADEAFRKIDVYISALLLELCEKKHPKWSRKKVLEKYWYVDAKGHHHYALPDKREVRVKSLADTLFIDYVPVRTNVNPYLDTDYLDWRTKSRQISSATGVYRSIWNRQEGRCHYCGKPMLRDEDIMLADLASEDGRSLDKKAYVHARCMDGTIEYIDTEEPPASLDDVMELLGRLEERRQDESRQFYLLSEFFRVCNKNSVTLTFSQIEKIMDAPLGEAAETEEFWYRTGFLTISQCWLDNGYEIRRLHLDGNQRVVFHLTSRNKNTSSVDLPAVIRFNRIPVEAKYELENYFRYIIKKYGLS